MSKVLLEVKNLKKYFQTPKGQLHAVDNVNFAIEEGKDAVLSTGSNIANSVWKGAKGPFGGH